MKLRINDECEVVIDWALQSVEVRRVREVPATTAERPGPVYTWVDSPDMPDCLDLVVYGVRRGGYYVWEHDSKFFGVPLEPVFRSREEAQAAVIKRYEADHA